MSDPLFEKKNCVTITIDKSIPPACVRGRGYFHAKITVGKKSKTSGACSSRKEAADWVVDELPKMLANNFTERDERIKRLQRQGVYE